MSWWEVFKLKQVNVGSTKLNNKEILEEEEDINCCEEAWERTGRTDYDPKGCEPFFNYVKLLIRRWERAGKTTEDDDKESHYAVADKYREIILDWCKCDNTISDDCVGILKLDKANKWLDGKHRYS